MTTVWYPLYPPPKAEDSILPVYITNREEVAINLLAGNRLVHDEESEVVHNMNTWCLRWSLDRKSGRQNRSPTAMTLAIPMDVLAHSWGLVQPKLRH